MKKRIYLLQLGELNKLILRTLKKNLKWSFKSFNLSIEISDGIIPLTPAEYNPLTRQYDANLLMPKLFERYLELESFRILGILDHDIYVNRYNFIFGSARNPNKIFSLTSPVALISVFRLREEFYGLGQNQALFELRVLKEALHELGHTFGLTHCGQNCIMYFSNSIEHTDNKPARFCKECTDKLAYLNQGENE